MVGSKLDDIDGEQGPYAEGPPIERRRVPVYSRQRLSSDQLNKLQTAVYNGGDKLERVMRELGIS